MATTTAARTIVPDDRIAIRVSWEIYQLLAETLGDQKTRLAYCDGVLELMSPGPHHEDFGERLRRLVTIVTEERDHPCKGLGATRWDAEEAQRGLEADASYYLTAEKASAAVRLSREGSNRAADYPVPDLAIEIDIRRSAVDRAAIYASLGLPEVWRFDGKTFRIDQLQDDGTYAPSPESRFLPIRAEAVTRWLLEIEAEDDNAWARLVRERVRAELAGRARGA